MAALGDRFEQPAVTGSAVQESAIGAARLQQRLDVVQDEKTAPFAQELQHRVDLSCLLAGRHHLLVRQKAGRPCEPFFDWRRVAHAAPVHSLELSRPGGIAMAGVAATIQLTATEVATFTRQPTAVEWTPC